MASAFLTDDLVAVLAERAQELEPNAIAVLLRGSHARGLADAHSDLDLTAITRREPRARYRTWFADRPNLPPLHVSVGACTAEQWLERGHEPVKWALRLAAVEESQYLWRTDDAVSLLGEPPSRHHPPDVPELEDFVEASVKAARGRNSGDAVLLRVSARVAAELAPRLLLPLNPVATAHDRRDAIRLALEFNSAPDGYREDLAICLGVTAVDDHGVADAIERLSIRLLAFLREQDPDVDPQPGVADHLRNGTLERHVEHAFRGV